jgi:hypothetical protein
MPGKPRYGRYSKVQFHSHLCPICKKHFQATSKQLLNALTSHGKYCRGPNVRIADIEVEDVGVELHEFDRHPDFSNRAYDATEIEADVYIHENEYEDEITTKEFIQPDYVGALTDREFNPDDLDLDSSLRYPREEIRAAVSVQTSLRGGLEWIEWKRQRRENHGEVGDEVPAEANQDVLIEQRILDTKYSESTAEFWKLRNGVN